MCATGWVPYSVGGAAAPPTLASATPTATSLLATPIFDRIWSLSASKWSRCFYGIPWYRISRFIDIKTYDFLHAGTQTISQCHVSPPTLPKKLHLWWPPPMIHLFLDNIKFHQFVFSKKDAAASSLQFLFCFVWFGFNVGCFRLLVAFKKEIRNIKPITFHLKDAGHATCSTVSHHSMPLNRWKNTVFTLVPLPWPLCARQVHRVTLENDEGRQVPVTVTVDEIRQLAIVTPTADEHGSVSLYDFQQVRPLTNTERHCW